MKEQEAKLDQERIAIFSRSESLKQCENFSHGSNQEVLSDWFSPFLPLDNEASQYHDEINKTSWYAAGQSNLTIKLIKS